MIVTEGYGFETTKLPKDIKDKWVKALRSGTYKQGKGLLLDVIYDETSGENKFKNTYCCLGVLGDVCGIDSKQLEGTELLIELSMEEIPNNIYQEAKDFFDNEMLQQMLADNNDGAIVKETGSSEIGKARITHPKATFLELADWIEENL